MGHSRAILFPSLLFVLLILLTTVTGFLQFRVIEQNIHDLLRNEGDILFKHIDREIVVSLQHLDLLDESPSLITPNVLNIMVYDEAIVEYLYAALASLSDMEKDDVPLKNVIIVGRDGKVLRRRGKVRIGLEAMRLVLTGKRESVLVLPAGPARPLSMGVRLKGADVFFTLDEGELDDLRKQFIVKEILEGEGKRFGTEGIRILDSEGKAFVAIPEATPGTGVLTIARPLTSKHLPGFTMEIFLSTRVIRQILEKTIGTLVFILTLLVIAGGMSAYAVFLLQRKHEGKVKEMERQMELKERLVSLGRLASGMAHEIRNPLNAIGMSVQRLRREFPAVGERQGDYEQFIDIIRSELSRVDRIVEDFLLSAKAQAPFMREGLADIIEEVLILLREKAESRRITVGNLVDRSIFVECQRDRLKQVFYNLILNGIEAIQRNGTIEVTARAEGEAVTISVKDSGPGIRKEQQRAVFEYYFTTKDKGMGLGLPISYMIVKDHGGDITLTSDEGKGADFLIRMPIIRDRRSGHGDGTPVDGGSSGTGRAQAVQRT
jgi:signal transduction histidine kinase